MQEVTAPDNRKRGIPARLPSFRKLTFRVIKDWTQQKRVPRPKVIEVPILCSSSSLDSQIKKCNERCCKIILIRKYLWTLETMNNCHVTCLFVCLDNPTQQSLRLVRSSVPWNLHIYNLGSYNYYIRSEFKSLWSERDGNVSFLLLQKHRIRISSVFFFQFMKVL